MTAVAITVVLKIIRKILLTARIDTNPVKLTGKLFLAKKRLFKLLKDHGYTYETAIAKFGDIIKKLWNTPEEFATEIVGGIETIILPEEYEELKLIENSKQH
jgi:hypothetical protein